ncbi:MAG: beta-N-acetylhexosaminidase [Planctomycetota bacterium]|jgi:hexosaminidase
MTIDTIPTVRSFETLTGAFNLSKPVCIQHDATLSGEGRFLRNCLSEQGVPQTETDAPMISLERGFHDAEAYELCIEPDSIRIVGGSASGVYYGIQTLRQMLMLTKASRSAELPCVDIKDSPRFSWRGFMLDESRHFFGKEYVKKILDWMAMLKLNRFHWHLTDAPAWRIEILKYPKLTEVGSIGSWSDPNEPSTFYTQDDIREIANYATERHIVVIPEIDMPGHATAANRAYPEFSGGGSERCPGFTFNPGKEGTYQFLTDILDEVAGLFPGPWIHFGADEVHFGNEQWPEDPHVKELMKRESLDDIKQVEFHFIKRIVKHINGLGKTAIGWDEVIESGASPETTAIMWWRQDFPENLEKALSLGFGTIICPRIPCYFDFIQDTSHEWGRGETQFGTTESLYAYPVEEKLPSDGRECILGIQGCLWTERIKGTERADFMTFPRLFALAEAGWTRDEDKDLASFNQRVQGFFPMLEAEGITYYNYFDPATTPEVPGVDQVTGPSKLEEEIQEGPDH